MPQTPPLSRAIAGKRPDFHDAKAVDRLITMVLTLAQELSVLRDRVDTMERLGAAAGWLAPGAIEAYDPPTEVRASREARREAEIERLFYALRQDLFDLETGQTRDDYWSAVRAIETGGEAPAAKSAKRTRKKPP
jgi:hypothetical protein